MKAKTLFITGTDTGVGKTVITGLFGRWLTERGYNVVTQKWIQTGEEKDILHHLRIMGKEKTLKEYMEEMNPYSFSFPASPHLASSLEGKEIDQDKIVGAFTFLCGKFEIVLVEGVGGVLVPIDKKTLLIDIVRRLKLPVLIVALNRLGAINHTLLTIEALRRREVEIVGIVFNNLLSAEDKIILSDNQKIITHIGKTPVFGALEYKDKEEELFRGFIKIGEGIYKRWMSG